jgi:hypothetical protein
MAITLTQNKSGNGGGYSNTNAQLFSSNVTAGNLIVLAITAGTSDTISSVTDNLSNTYLLAVNDASADRRTWIYYAQNIAAGTCTITVTFESGQFPDSIVQAREYSGIATTSALDVTISADTGTGYENAHPSGTSASTSQADQLVFTAVGSSGSASPAFTVPSGYSNFLEQAGFDAFTYSAIADKIVSTTGTQTASFGSTEYVRSQTVLATFKEAVAPVVEPIKGNFFMFL